jgi:CTP-dependent riboflavin kinase
VSGVLILAAIKNKRVNFNFIAEKTGTNQTRLLLFILNEKTNLKISKWSIESDKREKITTVLTHTMYQKQLKIQAAIMSHTNDVILGGSVYTGLGNTWSISFYFRSQVD